MDLLVTRLQWFLLSSMNNDFYYIESRTFVIEWFFPQLIEVKIAIYSLVDAK